MTESLSHQVIESLLIFELSALNIEIVFCL
jgi:hypothetical protein